MEPIKQEIINNIFENGDKLITGPILQTVLIDMIDDVNVKDQEILSKTGSWDEAVTQIPNLATKAELTEAKDSLQANITNLSESVARDLTDYATETWVQDQGYLKEHQDISNLATKSELTEAENNLQGNITSLSESVARDLANVDVDLTGYATETWVQSQGYLKEHQDISNLATKTELNAAKDNLQGNITSLSESVARDIANVSVPEGVATEAWVQSQDYASKSYVDNAVSSSSVDLTGYATETWVESQGYLKEHQDISNLATKSELNSVSESIQTDISNLATKGELNEAKDIIQTDMLTLSESMAKSLDDYTRGIVTEIQNQDYASKTYVNEAVAGINLSDYATKSELTSVSESVQTDITNLSESVATSAVWKKGTGESSIVQKLTGNNEANTPTATGYAAVAVGFKTTASGDFSHAGGEGTLASGRYSYTTGQFTTASGDYGHAEGDQTTALGKGSHAEGYHTTATGNQSHAEGDTSNASGMLSHAEGQSTLSSGQASHAEGFFTVASNAYEHAQGRYNHNSENQIFSIGTGNSNTDRRNAVSVLEVDNSGSYTSSFFVQNVGGYDGTNPTPGTNDLATVINGMSTGGGSSETLWEKGTGTDSIVQILTGDREANTPTATGTGSIATGEGTKASGNCSHAEGSYSNASSPYSHAEGEHTTTSGYCSHAEGMGTTTSGMYSHAEGNNTKTSNGYEHAQGRYNHNSENQIFSIGTGNSGTDRRNAVSVLEVDNSGSFTSSLFVQNIGGYDGTNPIPGTNDLATVINGMSSSGGSSSGGSSETLWKKGTGTDSMVQVLTGEDEAYTPTATGKRAIAVGFRTNASGYSSYAEGNYTNAEGNSSHAEGVYTEAKGVHSHTEGFNTIASNECEHAQGQYNHSSTNQIFSIGAGESIKDPDTQVVTTTRRNAVSVLAVPNSDSKILTASFFVQNIGGYDGTNPLPGTNDLATVINGMSTGGGSSETLWKKGEGQNSIVQILTGNDEAYAPIATGVGAIAIGLQTTASGDYSHAEGENTEASGYYSHAEGCGTNALGQDSHAEGYYTTASGDWSHAEGYFTVAPNSYECVLGMCNHSSEGQIFSVGAGEGDPFNPFDPKPITRRNAISILAVPNSETQINTASVFIQNIGGYDGTNPTPGTNDLATVINGMSTGGGIGTSSETWTFTLEDGSTVTKNIVMR